MKGGFVEIRKLDNGKELKTTVLEDSLLIPNIKKKELLYLGSDFIDDDINNDQDSVIFKNDDEFYEIGTSRSLKNVGKILNKYKSKSGRDNLLFDEELFKQFFSKLKKGSHRDKKFLFTMKEGIGIGGIFSQRIPKHQIIPEISDITQEEFESIS